MHADGGSEDLFGRQLFGLNAVHRSIRVGGWHYSYAASRESLLRAGFGSMQNVNKLQSLFRRHSHVHN